MSYRKGKSPHFSIPDRKKIAILFFSHYNMRYSDHYELI